MDNYTGNGTDAAHMAGRHVQQQPPRADISHNPQGQVPHMFGNFNPQPNNAYPQIHMPVHMHPQIAQQANPNLSSIQNQYPPAPYSNPAPLPASAQPPPLPQPRPRDWETPDQRAAIERESKRARPYLPGPNDPPYDNHYPPQFNRNQSVGVPPHPRPVGMPMTHQIPRMPPTSAPAIHPPNHPFVRRNNFNPPINIPPRGPAPQQRDDYQYPQIPNRPYPNQPPGQPNSYDSLPPPGRKDMQQISDRNKRSAPDFKSLTEKEETEETEENPISFKDFLLKQPDTISPQDAKEKYDLYLRDFSRKKPNKFFNDHKNEEWFKERYDPDYVLSRAERIKEEVQARAGDFKELWDKAGATVCAPDISSASLDKKFEKRGRSAPPSDVPPTEAGHKEEVKTDDSRERDKEDSTKEKPAQKIEEQPAKEENSVKEDPSVKEDSDVKRESCAKQEISIKEGPSSKQDSSVKQEHSVKEVPNNKEKDRIEATKYETELKQEDITMKAEDIVPIAERKDDDMKDSEDPGEVRDVKDEGKLQNSIDETQEAECYTKEKEAEASDTKEKSSGVEDSEKGKTDKEADEVQKRAASPESVKAKHPNLSPDLILPLRREHQKHTIFMRGIPINIKRKDLTKVLKHGPDGRMDLQLRRLKIGDINPMRGLERFAWAVYASEEAASIAIENVRGVVVRSGPEKEPGGSQASSNTVSTDGEDESRVYSIDCMINLQRKKRYTQGRILPPILGTPERMKHDVSQATKMMRCLDKLREVCESLNPLTDEVLGAIPSDAERLDHIVTYLREVHYFCYYSGNEFLEDSTSMPPQELRPCGERLDRPMSENDFRVVKRVDERAKWVLERDYDRPRSNSDNAELAKKAAIESWLDSNTKNEGQGRYRCGLPPHKLFKGPAFVHKHLRTKHADKMKTVATRAYLHIYRANFENDPSKDEVISIYNDGLASAQQKPSGGRPNSNHPPRQTQQFGFPQGRQNPAMGVYNPTGGFMGMGMQPFPMMMMSSTPGYPAGYTAAGVYPNPMAMAGRGMGTMSGQGMNPSLMPVGMQGVDGAGMQGHAPHRGRDGSRDGREGGYRGVGHRGGRRGGYMRRGGDHFRRGHGDGRPLDPRASGPRRTYNDLDAPANGPSFDLVRYDDV